MTIGNGHDEVFLPYNYADSFISFYCCHFHMYKEFKNRNCDNKTYVHSNLVNSPLAMPAPSPPLDNIRVMVIVWR